MSGGGSLLGASTGSLESYCSDLRPVAMGVPVERIMKISEGTPQEVATFARFLVSNEAAFFTGTDYPMDGGFLRLHG